MNNYDACLQFTLQQEGGWTNNPHDPGGCTMKGITLPAYRSWKHDSSLTCDDLSQISDDDVSDLYCEDYWMPVQGNDLPNGVDLMVWDMGVNAGVRTSVKLLQAVLGMTMDGNFTSDVLDAVNNQSAASLINNLATHQSDYYRSLGGFPYFGRGWLNRVNARRSTALGMVSNSTVMPKLVPQVMASYKGIPEAAIKVHPEDTVSDDFWIYVGKLHAKA